MTAARLFAIAGILVLASVGWAVLGHSVTSRTRSAQEELGAEVERMFGPRIVQPAPSVGFVPAGGGEPAAFAPPDATEASVEFDHEHRYRGLVWFSVYRVAFEATYTIEPPAGASAPASARFRMALPGDATIDGLEVSVSGQPVAIDSAAIDVPVVTGPGAPATVRVRYLTSGQDSWVYRPQTDLGGLRRFRLVARANFEDVDYPATGLSPTVKAGPRRDLRPGAEAAWEYAQMIPARNHTIGLAMPRMPDSGRLSARLSHFAPVSLLFFFAVMVVIQVLRGWRLHPMHYLLVAAGFFAFHVLLAYLVDHLPIHAAFWASAAVSVLLVVSYLRLVLGGRAAVLVAGAAQLVYLVLFSYAFFWEGWTGLTVVIGAIVTLFVVMQMTGRVDWERALGSRPAAPPRPPGAA